MSQELDFSTAILDILPNPVLVKNQDLEYVWVNTAFEELFSVKREDLAGKLDAELFPNRQVAQCNGGDLRVLNSGEIDESVETVFEKSGESRETITRKIRLETGPDTYYLIGVMHDITDVTRANEALTKTQSQLELHALELVRLATTDLLTGCKNRRALEDCESKLLKNQKSDVAVLLMDIDRFKSINDSYGHDCGDQVLKHFADKVREIIPDDDYFIRLGGEEFAVVIPGLSADESLEKADAVRKIIENSPIPYQGKELSYTVSIGVAVKCRGSERNMADMLKDADCMLYEAKSGGRNQVKLAA